MIPGLENRIEITKSNMIYSIFMCLIKTQIKFPKSLPKHKSNHIRHFNIDKVVSGV